jgi:hypothetical protein
MSKMREKLIILLILLSPLYLFPERSNAQSITSINTDTSNKISTSKAEATPSGITGDTEHFKALILKLDAFVFRLQHITSREVSRFEKIKTSNNKVTKLNRQIESMKNGISVIKNDFNLVKVATQEMSLKSSTKEYSNFRNRVVLFKSELNIFVNTLTKLAEDMRQYDINLPSPTKSIIKKP